MSAHIRYYLSFIFGIVVSTSIPQPASKVVVDLDYAVQQGTLANSSSTLFYRFGNIRYGAAERFGEPTTPVTNRTLQTGEDNISCAQYSPAWGLATNEYLAGETPVWPTITKENAGEPPAGTQDDCLFLDLLVPEAVFTNKTAPAAVIFYIHGGGYTGGDKAGDDPGGYEGAGYMSRSKGNVIFISMSYRLGLFGWLAGPSFQKHAAANLGLRDQRFALEWVQMYIRRFGGDPDRVLIMGESAGGGSVLHQIIYQGGKNKAPFKYAVPQSPWHQPIGAQKAESVYQETLRVANVSTFTELQSLDFTSLWKVNAVVVGNSRPYSTFNFGPTVDGDVLPDTYTNLMRAGAFDRSLDTLVGHNSDEGAIFASPFIHNETAYITWLNKMFPTANSSIIDYISQKLYPPVFDGSQGYTDWFGRVDATVGDSSIVCNAYLISSQFNKHNGENSSFAYLFSVPPGHHAQDIPYTMYSAGYSQGVNATIAQTMQGYFYNLAGTGNPNGPGLPHVPYYNQSGLLQEENFNITGIVSINSDNTNRRCEWWAKGLYQ